MKIIVYFIKLCLHTSIYGNGGKVNKENVNAFLMISQSHSIHSLITIKIDSMI
ncbi:hypothetical protein Syun_025764 [Stephania yunnanensis]|uniref:Uncharacterized protein n=1 Tax=Stephania yunnanensis TaxID=152371 RepID=A0AAP0ESR4_9MAGN